MNDLAADWAQADDVISVKRILARSLSQKSRQPRGPCEEGSYAHGDLEESLKD